MPITLPRCSGRAASGRHCHSSCDRSPIHHLRSLLRHPQTLWQHCGPATRDKTGSARLPLLFRLLRLTRLPHHTYGPGPTTYLGRGPVSPRTLQRGMPITYSRSPGLPGAHACPAPVGARKTLTCGAHETPLHHIWGTVHPTATITPPVGAGRTPARSPRDEGRYPGRPPR